MANRVATATHTPFRRIFPQQIPVDHERIFLQLRSDGSEPIELDKRYICWSVDLTQTGWSDDDRPIHLKDIKFFIQNKEDGSLVLREHLVKKSLQYAVLVHLNHGRVPMYGAITHVQFSGTIMVEAFSNASERAGPSMEVCMHRFYELIPDPVTRLVDLSDFDGFAVGIYGSSGSTIILDDNGFAWPVWNTISGFQVLDKVFETPHVANGRYKINKSRRLWTNTNQIVILFEEIVNMDTASVRMPHHIVRSRHNSSPMTTVDPATFIEGYWFDPESPGTTCIYPMPVEVDIYEYNRPEHQQWRAGFRYVLDNIEKFGGTIVEFLGSSKSRLTNESVGNAEYTIKDTKGNTWRFPEGLRHYYLDHRVLPSVEFTAFIDGLLDK